MPAQISKTAELIAGYTLQERIGSGGYGEVWRAEAPGGLLKAIKFIYGRFDEERASCELKALHRIKEVRHPFLLSLERIEVIDGQLVIVTELAEASLNDRFEACKAARMPGIPRDELLRYLHDAADALDYMSEQFSLQHLDIKPENLLILGGRVKIADFGLVKDVQDVTISLMSGMTPVYAAPEVFDGHPTLQSDQYSLAIVYQEMLSGILPFPGKTPSQLTSQHQQGHPRLTPLPLGDRPIIARGLDKDPQLRFGSCRELIEALQGAERVVAPAAPAPTAQASPEKPSARQIYRTVTLSSAAPSNDTAAERHPNESPQSPAEPTIAPSEPVSLKKEVSIALADSEKLDTDLRKTFHAIDSLEFEQEVERPLNPPAAVFEDLPPLKEEFSTANLRPTLVIGVGGTATLVLLQLQRRWQERFGNLEDIPCIQTLLLDTDSRMIDKLSSAPDQACRLIRSQHLPLRKPEEYRERSDHLMRWLGHRWIYNIPRSLRTEGLRPLGRLALVDHAEEVTAQIRKALKSITSPESIDESSRQSKMPISETTPLIYLIASISGGSGSGMILDLAFVVRQILAKEGINTAKICGMLMHGTVRHAAEKKLALANTLACLRELRGYRRKYPGEEAFGIPASKDGHGPFDDTYFLHLGDDLNDLQFVASTEKIADYIYLDAATACRGFFEKCRTTTTAAEPPVSSAGTLRTFGLSRFGFTPDDIPAAEIESLCRNLVDHWGQSPSDIATARLAAKESAGKSEHQQSNSAASAILKFESLCGKIEELVHKQIHDSDAEALEETLEKTYQFSIPPAGPESTINRAEKTLDVLFSTVRSLAENDRKPHTADRQVRLPFQTLAKTEAAALQSRILERFESSESGLLGLQTTIDELQTELRRREHEDSAKQERLVEIIAQAEQLLLTETAAEKKSWLRGLFGRKEPSRLTPCWNDYAKWRLELIILHGQRYLWHELQAFLTVLGEQLRDLRQGMQTISPDFQTFIPQAESLDANGNGSIRNLLKNTWEGMLRKHKQVLVGRLDRCLRHAMLSEGLNSAENRVARKFVGANWAESLRHAVRQELSKLLQEIDLAGLVLSSEGHAADASTPLKLLLEQAQPHLYSACGGSRRLLVVCPAGSATPNIEQKIEADYRSAPSIAQNSSPEIVFCYEVEQVPPLRIAAQLLENHGDCRAIASKLRSRIDVSWPRDF